MPHSEQIKRTIKLPGSDISVAITLTRDINGIALMFIDTNNIESGSDGNPKLRVHMNTHTEPEYTRYTPLHEVEDS